jgi:hypothetical protein
MHHKNLRHATCVLVMALAVGWSWRSTSRAGTSSVVSERLVFVTEDLAEEGGPGCDAVSAFDVDSGMPVWRGGTQISPGRLAIASDSLTALATQANGPAFVYILRSRDRSMESWESGRLMVPKTATFGGIAVLPDNATFLVGTSDKEGGVLADVFQVNRPPFFIEKYLIPNEIDATTALGPSLGRVEMPDVPVKILLSPRGHTAEILTDRPSIHTLDIGSMKQTAAPIAMSPVEPWTVRSDFPVTQPHRTAVQYIHGSLTQDGRYMVMNGGNSNRLGVADLDTRKSWTLGTSVGVTITGGVAINHSKNNPDLLAVHAFNKVVVYEFNPVGPLRELGRIEIDPGVALTDFMLIGGPYLAIAWDAGGSHLIAASVPSDQSGSEFIVLNVEDGGKRLSVAHRLVACDNTDVNLPNDIATTNGSFVWGEIVTTPTATKDQLRQIYMPFLWNWTPSEFSSIGYRILKNRDRNCDDRPGNAESIPTPLAGCDRHGSTETPTGEKTKTRLIRIAQPQGVPPCFITSKST